MPWCCLCTSKKKKKKKTNKQKDKKPENPDNEQEHQLLPPKHKNKHIIAKNSQKNSAEGNGNLRRQHTETASNEGDSVKSYSQIEQAENEINYPETNIPNNQLHNICIPPDRNPDEDCVVDALEGYANHSEVQHATPDFSTANLLQSRAFVNSNEHGESNGDKNESSDKNMGNYDEIPYSPRTRSCTVDASLIVQHLSFSDEKLPYIDEDAFSKPSLDSDDVSDMQSECHLKASEVEKMPEKKDSPSLNISEQNDSKNIEHGMKHASLDVNHNFRSYKPVDCKRCQLCHDPMTKSSTVAKCEECDLTCHIRCAASLPNVRYHDISFIIFRKWLESQEKYAFPTLYRYCHMKKVREPPANEHLSTTDYACARELDDSKYDKDNHHLTNGNVTTQPNDSAKTSNNELNHGSNEDIVNDTKALELSKIDKPEKIGLHIIESNRNTVSSDRSSKSSQIYVNPTRIRVDVHHRPDSEVLLICENINPRIVNTKDNVPDKNECSENVDFKKLNDKVRSSPAIENTDQGNGNLVKHLKNHKEENGGPEHQYAPNSQSFPVSATLRRINQNSLRLHYVTQRILASILPKDDQQAKSSYEKEVISMLERKHGKNYRVFDLESCLSVITLERICELCKHIDSWLADGQEKVVVLQDRDDRQRLGTAIAAYLEYLDICSSNCSLQKRNLTEDASIQNTIERNWLDLDIFSMKKFLEDFISPLNIPSHNRYLQYFSGLLSGKIRMNSSALFLNRISIESPPTLIRYDNGLSLQSPEWITFVKIYEGLRCVYTSDIHIMPVSTRQFLFEIGGLRLRGDIMIRCYRIIPSEKRNNNGYHRQHHQHSEGSRDILFSIQFHTCALTESEVVFRKSDLDLACDDPRFPNDHKVTLHVSKSVSHLNGMMFQSPLIRTMEPNGIARYDSIDDLDCQPSCHTQGPIDGSLYATILKSPKSTSPVYSSQPSTSVSQPQRESFGQLVLSPPPQFSNREEAQVNQQRHEFITGVAVSDSAGRDTVDQRQPTPVSAIRNQQSIVPDTSRSLYATNVEKFRSSTSQSNYPEASNSKYTIPVNINPTETRQITIVETYNKSTDAANNQNFAGTNRQYAHSPLTLSMDSGISSSGVLNRPLQESSVSPSSFPSQASPQEDRHRELDDILSDMLMTVQDIPDFSKYPSQQNRQPTYPIIRSQSVIPSSGNYAIPSQIQEKSQYSSIRRSQSYVSEPVHPSTYSPRDCQDFYDTTSTATTLTPPPSESGRDTPIVVYSNSGSIGNFSTLQYQHQHQHREKREAIRSPSAQQQQQQPQHQPQRRDQQLTMSVHQRYQQSSAKPQQVRTEVGTVSASEEEEIPYHAREHSQPFSYGSVPSEDEIAMIKAQSGLSSPSLVRKTFGRSPSPSALRKTEPRIDFEDLLRERREKVMSDKYPISDRHYLNNSTNVYSRSYGSEKQWPNSATLGRPQDPYSMDTYRQSYEPIRRSNTMDGGFHRSNSTDGISGQTWLQMQQQKLRAKKDQQHREGRRYYDEYIHNEIRSRPARSRANPRFDGYASDTAAFTDEVDYRRPLQVQTPYNQYRVPDDTYQTKTVTTTTVTKERPFVAVRRAHQEAKQNTIGSPPLSPLTVLNASPNGHISQVQPQQHQSQNGLLSMANNNNSPNGHVRLLATGMENVGIENSPSTSENLSSEDLFNSLENIFEILEGVSLPNTKIDYPARNSEYRRRGKLTKAFSDPSSEFIYPTIKEQPIMERYQSTEQLTQTRRENQRALALSYMLSDLTTYTRSAGLPQARFDNNDNNNRSSAYSNFLVSNSIPNHCSARSSFANRARCQVREESFSSYRSEVDPEISITGSPRPETPAFPVTPRTPYGLHANGNVSPALPPKSPTSLRKDLYTGSQKGHLHEVANQNETISCYASRRNSNTSNANSEPQEVAPHLVKFVRDSSKYWYKPNISREDAVALLRKAEPGTFIVRDSTTYKNAFGLVLRVAQPPPGVELRSSTGDELVRHFLVEPTSRGVRLKGCNNEPVFSSLSALVYQHSITPLALPCRLIIPDQDIQLQDLHSPAQRQLLAQGAACNVLHLFTGETESLTGEEAIRKAVSQLFANKRLPIPTEVHFKAAQQGITLTDNTRQKFFRKHYPSNTVSFCGLDPERRTWSIPTPGSDVPVTNKTIFAFVARRTATSKDNQCHVFCDMQANQPALAIVSFVNKVLPTEKYVNQSI